MVESIDRDSSGIPSLSHGLSPTLPKSRPSRQRSKKAVLPVLAVDAKQLAQILSAGLRTVRAWDSAGKLPKPIRLGGRTLWYVPEIQAWMEAGSPNRETWETMKSARKMSFATAF